MNSCPYCGRTPEPTESVADHIYPVSLGGLSTVDNMVWVCASCNKAKGKLTLRRFCVKMGFDHDEVCATLEGLGKNI